MRRGTHRKFGREKNLRGFLYKSLATALIDHGKIKTTQAKAKSLSGFMDKTITTAIDGDIASRRLLSTKLGPKAVKKLVDEIAPRFSAKGGGYTRIIKLGQRRSDGAEMAIIEFTK